MGSSYLFPLFRAIFFVHPSISPIGISQLSPRSFSYQLIFQDQREVTPLRLLVIQMKAHAGQQDVSDGI